MTTEQNESDKPFDPYYGQVWYDEKSKRTYEYLACGEGSVNIHNDPITGYWQEINWDNKRSS